MAGPRTRTRTASTWIAAGVLAALAGCSTTPVYQRPDMAIPAGWSHGAAAAATPGSSQWWQAFGSPELDALVARGLAGGFDLKIALHRLEQARGRADMAAAARYPSLGLAADASRSGPGTSTSTGSVTLQGGIDLDVWGRNGAIASSASSLAQAARFDADAVQAALVEAIAGTYFQALSLDERVRLAGLIADDAQQTLQLVETQARLGAASQLEVEQQRNALQTVQAGIPLLAQQRDQAIGDLAVLIGIVPEGFQLAARDLRAVQVPDVAAGAPADAIARLPQVRSAEAQLQAANFDVGAARAAFLPTLSVTATLGAAFNPAQALWGLAGSVLQPLFDGGLRQGQLRVDRAHAEELVVTYRKAIAQALQAAETRMQATAATRDAERLDEAAVASARRALELARIRLQHGATDFLTVLLSERTLYQAEDTALQIRLQRLQATVGLFGALGSGQPLLTQGAAPAAAAPIAHATASKKTS
jgi:NodT family efflux transporter outer membrane factor (OMF) lipoprotein